jgi:hypothetical protein
MKTRNEHLFIIFASLLAGQQLGCDVGNDTALGNNDVAEELVQLLIVADRELEMAGYDTGNHNTG